MSIERGGLMMNEKLVYTVDEFANIMQVSPLTVRRWIKCGKVKTFKIGKAHRIAKEEIDRLKKGE